MLPLNYIYSEYNFLDLINNFTNLLNELGFFMGLKNLQSALFLIIRSLMTALDNFKRFITII
jgi:hypothetical protein